MLKAVPLVFQKVSPLWLLESPLSLSRNPVNLEKQAFIKHFQLPCSFLLCFAKAPVNAMHLRTCSVYIAGERIGKGCDGVYLPKSPCGGAQLSQG